MTNSNNNNSLIEIIKSPDIEVAEHSASVQHRIDQIIEIYQLYGQAIYAIAYDNIPQEAKDMQRKNLIEEMAKEYEKLGYF
jgi:uncharacterized protein (UPF0297 family)